MHLESSAKSGLLSLVTAPCIELYRSILHLSPSIIRRYRSRIAYQIQQAMKHLTSSDEVFSIYASSVTLEEYALQMVHVKER